MYITEDLRYCVHETLQRTAVNCHLLCFSHTAAYYDTAQHELGGKIQVFCSVRFFTTAIKTATDKDLKVEFMGLLFLAIKKILSWKIIMGVVTRMLTDKDRAGSPTLSQVKLL